MLSYAGSGRCDDGEGATRRETLVTSCSCNGSPQLSSQSGDGLGQEAKMVMVVETRQRLAAAIRACCEAMAHAPWPVVSTRSRVMVCPAAWIRRAQASAHAGSSVLWG
jgi:hypothetical protein